MRIKGVRNLFSDQDGQATVEWVLLLVAVVLPMVYLLDILLDMLVEFYGMVTFMETLPFP